MRRTALAIGALFVSATACNFNSTKSSSGVASSTVASDQSQADQLETLMKTSREWAKAASSGDVERILSYWADDAIVLEPDQHALFGKAVTIWRKDANGAWKCVIDTWNGSPSSNVYPAV